MGGQFYFSQEGGGGRNSLQPTLYCTKNLFVSKSFSCSFLFGARKFWLQSYMQHAASHWLLIPCSAVRKCFEAGDSLL